MWGHARPLTMVSGSEVVSTPPAALLSVSTPEEVSMAREPSPGALRFTIKPEVSTVKGAYWDFAETMEVAICSGVEALARETRKDNSPSTAISTFKPLPRDTRAP